MNAFTKARACPVSIEDASSRTLPSGKSNQIARHMAGVRLSRGRTIFSFRIQPDH